MALVRTSAASRPSRASKSPASSKAWDTLAPLLQDNLDASSVESFLAQAVAQKEAALLRSSSASLPPGAQSEALPACRPAMAPTTGLGVSSSVFGLPRLGTVPRGGALSFDASGGSEADVLSSPESSVVGSEQLRGEGDDEALRSEALQMLRSEHREAGASIARQERLREQLLREDRLRQERQRQERARQERLQEERAQEERARKERVLERRASEAREQEERLVEARATLEREQQISMQVRLAEERLQQETLIAARVREEQLRLTQQATLVSNGVAHSQAAATGVAEVFPLAAQPKETLLEQLNRAQAALAKEMAEHTEEARAWRREKEEMISTREMLEAESQAKEEALQEEQKTTARLALSIEETLIRHREALDVSERSGAQAMKDAAEAQQVAAAAIADKSAHAAARVSAEDRAAKAELKERTLEATLITIRATCTQLHEEREAAERRAEVAEARCTEEVSILQRLSAEVEAEKEQLTCECQLLERECDSLSCALCHVSAGSEEKLSATVTQAEGSAGQLRRHIEELEALVSEQQHENARARVGDAQRSEVTLKEAEAKRSTVERRNEMLLAQANDLGMRILRLEAEREVLNKQLKLTKQQLEEAVVEASVRAQEAEEAREGAEAQQAEMARLGRQHESLSSSLRMLEGQTRDAAISVRSAQMTSSTSLAQAAAAAREERVAEEVHAALAGHAELRGALDDMCSVVATLAASLNEEVTSAPLARDAAEAAAELHIDISTQLQAARAALQRAPEAPSAIAAVRSSLVDAASAQAQLTSQAVSHLIACAVDAEAVAQLQMAHTAAVSSAEKAELAASAHASVAALRSEVGRLEGELGYTVFNVEQGDGGALCLAREMRAIEDDLVERGAALNDERQRVLVISSQLSSQLEAQDGMQQRIDELTDALAAANARASELEHTAIVSGLEGRQANEQLAQLRERTSQVESSFALSSVEAAQRSSAARAEMALIPKVLVAEVAHLEALAHEQSEQLAAATAAAIEVDRRLRQSVSEHSVSEGARRRLEAEVQSLLERASQAEGEAAVAIAKAISLEAHLSATRAINASQANKAQDVAQEERVRAYTLHRAAASAAADVACQAVEAGLLVSELRKEERAHEAARSEAIDLKLSLERERRAFTAKEMALRERRVAYVQVKDVQLQQQLSALSRQLGLQPAYAATGTPTLSATPLSFSSLRPQREPAAGSLGRRAPSAGLCVEAGAWAAPACAAEGALGACRQELPAGFSSVPVVAIGSGSTPLQTPVTSRQMTSTFDAAAVAEHTALI